MKISTIMKFAALSAALVVGACTTKQQAASAPPPPPPPMAAAPVRQAPGILPGSLQDFKVNVGDTVHFAYNEYNVQDQDKGTLQKQASWLNRYPSVQTVSYGKERPICTESNEDCWAQNRRGVSTITSGASS